MSKVNASSLVAVAASMLLGLPWVYADAAVVRTTNSDAMQHTYGRAGVPIAADEMAEMKAAEQATASVGVTYSPDVAQWTNMPRSEAQEGPVTDALDSTDGQSVEHWFGRAGGPVGADELPSPQSRLSTSAVTR
jgi:hypothetical protein